MSSIKLMTGFLVTYYRVNYISLYFLHIEESNNEGQLWEPEINIDVRKAMDLKQLVSRSLLLKNKINVE